jgi:AcrR family transcriptional regulator
MEISSKRQEILDAARECFARFGYEKTTVDDIGKMVGMNKASLYYYYKSKEAIYGEVILYELQDAMQMLQSKIEDMPGCRDKLLTYFQKKLRHMHRWMNVHNLSMEIWRNVQPSLTHSQLFDQIKERESDFINAIMLDCIEHGEIKPCDTRRIARTILTVVEAVKTKAFSGIDARFVEKVDMAELEDDVTFAISLIWDGLTTGKESP